MSTLKIDGSCTIYAPFLSLAGAASALVLSTIGSAYGCAKSGIAIGGIGQFRPELVLKSLIPVVMSGIISVYGLIVAILISGEVSPSKPLPAFTGYVQLGAGLSVGLTGMLSGWLIGVIGDAGVRRLVQQERLFISVVLILIFAEVLALYGLITGLLLNSKKSTLC